MSTSTIRGTLAGFLLALLSSPAPGAVPVGFTRIASFGGAGADEARSMAIDPAGNLLVVGTFEGSIDFGGGPVSSAGGSDIFVVKLDPDLNVVWSRRFGGLADDLALGVCTSPAGNILVAGSFRGINVYLGPGTLYTSLGGSDAFVLEIDPGGNPLWSTRLGGVDDDVAEDVALDGTGRVLLAGSQDATATATSVLLIQLRLDHTPRWYRHYPGAGHSVAVWKNEQVLFALYEGADFVHMFDANGSGLGSVSSSPTIVMTDIATGPDESYFVAGSRSADAVVYSPAGWRTLRAQGTGASAAATRVAVAPDGDVIMAGRFHGGLEGLLTSDGNLDDGFVVGTRPDRTIRWALRLGGPENDTAGGLAVAPGGEAYWVAGGFRGVANFGEIQRTSAGATDVFIARIGVIKPYVETIMDVGNDQGGQVQMTFVRSFRDYTASFTPVTEYEVFRRDGASPPVWTSVRTVPAHAQERYSVILPTLQDAIPPGPLLYSVYFLRAKTADPGVFFDSPPDSGYSVDNLVPAPPVQLAYSDGKLTWAPSTAEDFSFFSVYGSAREAFDASAVLLQKTEGNTADVGRTAHAYYHVTATDRAGNQSGAAAVVAAPASRAAGYALRVSARPNPFNPQTVIGYEVPSNGHTLLEVFDARGVRLATLVDAPRDAGAYSVRWAGRDGEDRPVSSGVYFVRLRHDRGLVTHKIVLLK